MVPLLGTRPVILIDEGTAQWPIMIPMGAAIRAMPAVSGRFWPFKARLRMACSHAGRPAARRPTKAAQSGLSPSPAGSVMMSALPLFARQRSGVQPIRRAQRSSMRRASSALAAIRALYARNLQAGVQHLASFLAGQNSSRQAWHTLRRFARRRARHSR